MVGLTLACITLVVLAWFSDIPADGAAVITGFLGVSGAVCAFIAYRLFRRGRQGRARHLQLRLDRDELTRGDTVNVTLTVPDGDGAPENVQLGLECFERYDVLYGEGDRVRQTREEVAFQEWVDVAAGSAHSSASFALPVEGPFSYEGSCVSYTWRVSAIERKRGRGAR